MLVDIPLAVAVQVAPRDGRRGSGTRAWSRQDQVARGGDIDDVLTKMHRTTCRNLSRAEDAVASSKVAKIAVCHGPATVSSGRMEGRWIPTSSIYARKSWHCAARS